MDREDRGAAIKQRAKRMKQPFLKVLIRLLFSRLLFTAVVVLFQLGYLYFLLYRVNEQWKYFMQACNVLAVILILIIINSRSNEAYKISWSIIIAAVPLPGVFVYLLTHIDPINRMPFSRMRTIREKTSGYAVTSQPVRDRIRGTDEDFVKLAGYLERTGRYAAYDNTEIKYYPFGENVMEDMCRELEKAELFIFIEFFIIAEGVFWGKILEILEKKADEGVEVRVMYDDLGSMQSLPWRYYKKLRQKGILSHVFSPIRPFLSSYYNSRDHRKIMVIDGKVAFSGGINLADEYINEYRRFGTWKDNAFRLKGNAVRNYTFMFLQMWDMSNKKSVPENYDRYLEVDIYRTPDLENDGFVIPYADGPHQQDGVAENVYLDIINSASRNIDIMTPYLVPDNEILHALKHAAKSGVEVSLILPFIPDKRIVNLVSKSYYKELIRAGVHIYEYMPGFVHTKMVAADHEICSTGTVNLDFRSLYLHYECGCLIYKNAAVADIEEDFTKTLDECREITLDDIHSWTILFTIVSGVLRVFAPLF